MESIFKFLLGNISFKVEIIRSDEILDGQLTMREVSRIYGLYAKVLTNEGTFKVLCSVVKRLENERRVEQTREEVEAFLSTFESRFPGCTRYLSKQKKKT